MLIKPLTILSLFVSLSLPGQDYFDYHQKTIEAENFIVSGQYSRALENYQELLSEYDFVFLKDLKIGAQLALNEMDTALCFNFLSRSLLSGWTLEGINKHKGLSVLKSHARWDLLVSEFTRQKEIYHSHINPSLREEVRDMFKRDQKMALGALFRVGDKAQERYGEKKFAPHSERQMSRLFEIMDEYGYPGEQLIGNSHWVETIVSHHNSITQAYAIKDPLYPALRPELLEALGKGQISPTEFAIMDDWRRAVLSNRSLPGYGILDYPIKSTLVTTDSLRDAIGLRSVALHNQLLDVQADTGLELYLPRSWYGLGIDVRGDQSQ